MTLRHKHPLSLCSLEDLERPSLSVFVPACLPPRSAFWRTSKGSPWEQRLSWRLHSAPASTAHSRCGHRNAAYRVWSDTAARTPFFWHSAQSPPSESGRSPSRASPWIQPPIQRTDCGYDPRPGTAAHGPAAAHSLCGPVGAPGRPGIPNRTSGGSELGPPGSSSTRS